MELLPGFGVISKAKVPLHVMDELTQGLCQMVVTEDIFLWLTFATILFVDINYYLRESVDEGWKRLQALATQDKSTPENKGELSKGLMNPSICSKQNRSVELQLERLWCFPKKI